MACQGMCWDGMPWRVLGWHAKDKHVLGRHAKAKTRPWQAHALRARRDGYVYPKSAQGRGKGVKRMLSPTSVVWHPHRHSGKQAYGRSLLSLAAMLGIILWMR
ncbi:hypothetical protein Hdeb2414_s1297g01006731 [Helianthus debilis subsp. tardiflorus]